MHTHVHSLTQCYCVRVVLMHPSESLQPTQNQDYAVDKSTKSHRLSLPPGREADLRNEERKACLHQMLYSLKPGNVFHILYT